MKLVVALALPGAAESFAPQQGGRTATRLYAEGTMTKTKANALVDCGANNQQASRRVLERPGHNALAARPRRASMRKTDASSLSCPSTRVEEDACPRRASRKAHRRKAPKRTTAQVKGLTKENFDELYSIEAWIEQNAGVAAGVEYNEHCACCLDSTKGRALPRRAPKGAPIALSNE